MGQLDQKSVIVMEKSLPTNRETLKELNRACSDLDSLVGRLRMAMKSRSLEQSDKYTVYSSIEKYAHRLVELDRRRKLIKKTLRVRSPGPAKEGQQKSGTGNRSRFKKKENAKSKRKHKVRYPKTPIQVEHAAKKKQLLRVLRVFA